MEEVGISHLQGPGTPPAGEAARRPQQRLGEAGLQVLEVEAEAGLQVLEAEAGLQALEVEAGLQMLPALWTGGSHWHLRRC